MKNIFPVVPTSEAETLSFLQKLEVLDHRVRKLTVKVNELEEKIVDVTTISATGDSEGYLTTLTLDQTTYNIPNNGVVIAEGDAGGNLTSLTVDGVEYTIPEGVSVSVTVDSDSLVDTITIDGTTYNVSNVKATGNLGALTKIKVDGVEYTIPQGGGGSVVTATADPYGNLATITIDGDTYTVPAPGSNVSATGDAEDNLTSITVDGDTYNVPAPGDSVSVTESDGLVNQITINGVSHDVSTAASDVSTIPGVISDASLHIASVKFVKAGSLLSMKLGSLDNFTGASFTVTGLPGLDIINIKAPVCVNKYDVLAAESITLIGNLTLTRPYGIGNATLAFSADEGGVVRHIAADGTISDDVATVDDFKMLVGETITFML